MRKLYSFLILSFLCGSSFLASAQPLGNFGLVGVGRIPANSFDLSFPNDTLGGIFSAMAVDQSTIALNGSTYSAVLFAQPDRGFGDGTNDYHTRIEFLDLRVTPYAGPFPAASQNQIQLSAQPPMFHTLNGSTTFTGFNPDDTNVIAWPQSPANSPGQGHRSLDPEGLALRADGGFFVADEYGPFIYAFDDLAIYQYELHPPEAYIPRSGPAFGQRFIAYGTVPPQVATNDSGRFFNRGFEGVSLTPDRKKLVAVLQLPLQQDGENRNASRNTRILVFDVNPSSPTYKQPIAEYIYQLTLNGSEAHDRNTPISELLALSDTSFLVLERDSRGRGGDPGPILYKRVVRADVSGATDLLKIPGTPYDLEKGAPGQLSLPRTTLPAGIVPAARTDLVDLVDTNQLAKFGLNVNTNWDANTISEKWEGLAVLPLNGPNDTNDFLLLVGNDNDFKASTVFHNGQIVGTNALTVDSMMLAFRIGLDTNAPSLTGPGTVPVVQAGPGAALPDVTSFVTVTDNSVGPITLFQVPPSGSQITLSTPTNIIVIAIDPAGNRGQISFDVIVVGLTIQCPGPVTNAVGPDCLASMPDFISGATTSGAFGSVTIAQEPAPGTSVGAGTYTVTLTATDSSIQSNSCATTFTALGVAAPLSVEVTPTQPFLWPPNHKMVTVGLNVAAVGGCSAIQHCEVSSITSSEGGVAVSCAGSRDCQITGPLSVKLRAERAGTDFDRFYVIEVRCTDAAGNVVPASTVVTVPHDQRK